MKYKNDAIGLFSEVKLNGSRRTYRGFEITIVQDPDDGFWYSDVGHVFHGGQWIPIATSNENAWSGDWLMGDQETHEWALGNAIGLINECYFGDMTEEHEIMEGIRNENQQRRRL